MIIQRKKDCFKPAVFFYGRNIWAFPRVLWGRAIRCKSGLAHPTHFGLSASVPNAVSSSPTAVFHSTSCQRTLLDPGVLTFRAGKKFIIYIKLSRRDPVRRHANPKHQPLSQHNLKLPRPAGTPRPRGVGMVGGKLETNCRTSICSLQQIFR